MSYTDDHRAGALEVGQETFGLIAERDGIETATRLMSNIAHTSALIDEDDVQAWRGDYLAWFDRLNAAGPVEFRHRDTVGPR